MARKGYIGRSMSHTVSAASTNSTSVSSVGGNVWGVQAFNINAGPRYLKLYDKATAPTVGTDTPVKTLAIPGDAIKGNGLIYDPPHGIYFANGIAFALTTGIADNDTGAVAASELLIEIDYE
jgi:hypothetical protein